MLCFNQSLSEAAAWPSFSTKEAWFSHCCCFISVPFCLPSSSSSSSSRNSLSVSQAARSARSTAWRETAGPTNFLFCFISPFVTHLHRVFLSFSGSKNAVLVSRKHCPWPPRTSAVHHRVQKTEQRKVSQAPSPTPYLGRLPAAPAGKVTAAEGCHTLYARAHTHLRSLSTQRGDASRRLPLQLPSCKRHHQRQPPPPPSRILTHLMGGGTGEAGTLQHFRSAMGTASFRSRAQHSPVTVPATPRKREREREVTPLPPSVCRSNPGLIGNVLRQCHTCGEGGISEGMAT